LSATSRRSSPPTPIRSVFTRSSWSRSTARDDRRTRFAQTADLMTRRAFEEYVSFGTRPTTR
jgi:hypothetical protein